MGRPRASIPPNALVSTALTKTVTALAVGPADVAAVQLARKYASAIDDPDAPASVLKELGPLLLATLVQLGATPTARKVKGTAPDAADPVRTGMDDLRARRAARVNGT